MKRYLNQVSHWVLSLVSRLAQYLLSVRLLKQMELFHKLKIPKIITISVETFLNLRNYGRVSSVNWLSWQMKVTMSFDNLRFKRSASSSQWIQDSLRKNSGSKLSRRLSFPRLISWFRRSLSRMKNKWHSSQKLSQLIYRHLSSSVSLKLPSFCFLRYLIEIYFKDCLCITLKDSMRNRSKHPSCSWSNHYKKLLKKDSQSRLSMRTLLTYT